MKMRKKMLLVTMGLVLGLSGCTNEETNPQPKELEIPQQYQEMREAIYNDLEEQLESTTVYYINTEGAEIKQYPYEECDIITTLSLNTEIEIYDNFSLDGWSKCKYEDNDCYILSDYLSSEMQEVVNEVYNSAKEEIAWRESRGDYNAVNGRYYGRYQLDSVYLNGDYSIENQERVAEEYVMNRYGSWENALSFHNANGWY